MKKNLVAMMVTVVMVAGALVGCGSKEVAQETTPVVEATVEASVEEEVVEEATEEVSVEEEVIEEVPQTKQMKVLAGWIRTVDGEYTDIDSYVYDEYGNPVKVVWNDIENEELMSIVKSGTVTAEDFMNFGERYITGEAEYAEVLKSENGRIIECQWYCPDGTKYDGTAVFTYNEFGSQLTKDEAGNHIEYIYDDDGYRTSEHDAYADGTYYETNASDITSEVDEDGTITHVKYASGAEVIWYYTTIEVLVEE